MNGCRVRMLGARFRVVAAVFAIGAGESAVCAPVSMAPFAFGSVIENGQSNGRVAGGYCLYMDLPPTGYAPVEFIIGNGRLDRAESVRIECRTLSGPRQDAVTQRETISPVGTTRFLVPLTSAHFRAGYGILNFHFQGPAFASLSISMPRRGLQTSGALRGGGFFVALTERATLNTWDGFAKAVGHGAGASGQINATRFLPALLGKDWRGLAGVDVLWFSAAEWEGVAAESQEAVMDWVSRGGVLAFSGCGDFEQGAVPAASRGYALGFGSVIAAGLNEVVTGEEFAALYSGADSSVFDRTGRARGESAPVGYAALEYDSGNWMSLKTVQAPQFGWGWLMGFVALLALLIGPINLFLIAGGPRRMRIVWTTPLIAVAASLVLGAFMVVRDGFGGAGERISLVLLDGERHREVSLVEQAARTAILTNTAFETDHPLFMMPLPLATGVGGGFDLREDGLWRDGWFRSRTLETHLIERVKPSRSGVVIRSGAGGMEAVVSLEADLDMLIYCAPDGTRWVCRKLLKRGVASQLQMVAAPEAAEMLREAGRRFGPRLARAWRRVDEQPGWFYGVSTAPAGHTIDTLAGLRWNDVALICGPVDRLPTPNP